MKSVLVIDGDTIYINGYNTPKARSARMIAIAPCLKTCQSSDKNGER